MFDDLPSHVIQRLHAIQNRRTVVSGVLGLGFAALPLAADGKKRKKKRKKGRGLPQTCQNGMALCGEICLDTRQDPANCGACGSVCESGSLCCAGACHDPAQSEQHCGACGQACGAWQSCCDGACTDRWTQQMALGARLPYGVWASPDGETVWTTELWDGRVIVYRKGSRDWERQSTFGSTGNAADQLHYPEGLCASPDGTKVWVADTLNHRVSIWARDGAGWAPETTFGSLGEGPEHFSQPEDVVVSADGKTAWVADSFNGRIAVWRESAGVWTPLTQFGSAGNGPGQLNSPSGLAVSEDEKTVWVADWGNHRISIWTFESGEWQPSERFGSQGSRPNELFQPTAIAVSANGKRAWVSDSGNSRVLIWERRADGWEPQPMVDPNAARLLRQPRDVAVTTDGKTAWVADPDQQVLFGWLETGCAP